MTFVDTRVNIDTDTNTNTDTSPGNDILATDGAIAKFFLGEDTPKNRGRVRNLMCHTLPVEHRMPSCVLGGQRTSFKSWITAWIEECRVREQQRAHTTAEEKIAAKIALEADAVAAVKAADGTRYKRKRGRPARPRDNGDARAAISAARPDSN